jgi:L-iditol 2-dehydrogenase/galactitol-1-phosphate 5-dehydrogenase
MKAAVLRGIREIEISEAPLPEKIGTDSVLIKIGAVGVCGSDVLRFAVGKGYGFPLVLGHEMSGTVVGTSKSGNFLQGDKVAIFPCLPDPTEAMTEIGEFTMGTKYDYFGSRRDGGLQEYLEVPERNLVKLPSDMSLIAGAMVEPAGVALHAMRKVQIPANATALVIGAGPIGNFAAQWLRILGVTRVIVADIDPRKRQLLERLGFETISAEKAPTEEQVLTLTDGRGADISVEASGLAMTFLQALRSTSHKGQVVLLGDLSGDVSLPKELVSTILRRELIIYGTWNARITPRFNSEWDMVVNSIGKSLHVGDMVSHIFELDEAQSVFQDLADRKNWSNKTIFAISDEAQLEKAQVASSSFSYSLAENQI